MSTKISCSTARLDDAAGLAAFLEPIPNGAELGKLLQKREPLSSRAYDDDAWTARFVVSDGHGVTCFTVMDITIDQAEMIAAACEGRPALPEAEFRAIVAESLGPTAELAD